MVCPDIEEPIGRYLERFRLKVRQQRTPLSGAIELTSRCNLRCVHCYVGPTGTARGKEMSATEICRVLDDCAAAGCLTMLMTGGEPLLRPDFPEIYRHARRNGMLVTVFTNGTVLGSAALDALCELPPQAIEVTVYGATEATYERITGVPGAYRECIGNLDRMLARGLPVRIKTILMTLNRHELSQMWKMADERRIKFHFDAAIFPRLDGGQEPLEWRLSAREAVELEFSDDRRAIEWERNMGRVANVSPSNRLFGCGAGVSGFHVSPVGRLQPCVMTPWIGYDLLEGSFADGWREIARRIDEQKAPADFRCRTCDRKNFCGYCPAFFRLETGSETKPSDFLCELGQYRVDKLTERRTIGYESENEEATAI